MVLNNRFFYYWQSIDCQILVFNCSHIVYRIICDFFGGKKTTIQNELRFDLYGKFNDFWEFSIRLGNLLLWICVLSSNLIINLDSTDFDSDTFIRTYIKFKKKIQRNFWKSLLHDRWFIAIFFERCINHDKIRSRESSTTNYSNKQKFYKSSLNNKRRKNGETIQPFSSSVQSVFLIFSNT